MRLAVLGIVHESNTFAPVRASRDRFEQAGILRGDRIREMYADSQTTFAGYCDHEAEDPEIELVPLVFARMTPMGTITADAYEQLVGQMLGALRSRGPWDGVLLLIHGAAVADGVLDADGELIRRIRHVVGPDVPLGATLDMHANVSDLMVEHSDVLTVYQTNPHVDAREQGRACARLIGRTVCGAIRPRMSLVDPPLVVNILRQGTGDEPMAGLLRVARDQEKRPGVLSVSVVQGFPYADAPEMGMSFLAITDGDDALARDVASRVARVAWDRRETFVSDAMNIDDAVTYAAAAPGRPVVLLDVGDNIGGGSPGDSTHILNAARRLGVSGLLQGVCDPDAVRAGSAVGVGGRVDMAVGGKTDGLHGAPLPITGTVTAMTDGRFEDPTPTHGGFRRYDMGHTIAVRTDDGFELVISELPQMTTSLEQFHSVGLAPCDAKIVVAKGVHSPRAAFEPIAAEMIYVATPGCTTADLSTLSYRHRRRPMFPYEPNTAWAPS